MKIQIVIPPYHAALDHSAIRKFLKAVGDETKNIMVREAAAHGGSPSGPGEYPANKTGHLSASYKVVVGASDVTIGTAILVYPSYLRTGTRKMAARKFLMNALHEALDKEKFTSPFVRWRRG